MLKEHIEPDLMDNISILAGLGVLLAWLPTVFSLVSIIWFSIRIWESDTVRGLTNRKKPDANSQ
jgi:hypothetical protein